MVKFKRYLFLLKLLLVILILPVSACAQNAANYKIKIVETYKHDIKAYTQGLFFIADDFYESCGQYGESNLRRVELKSGRVLKKTDFPKNYFAEGSAHFNGKIFVLTWQERSCFLFDPGSFKNTSTYFYNREGWGLTQDGKNLIMSDGSSWLYFMDPSNFTDKSKLRVTLNGKPLEMLNELEYINGEIWANVYQTDNIVIINPKTGVVRAIIDCRNLLLPSDRKPDTDVLNGIAFHESSKSIYITGKNWPKLFKVEIVR